MFGRSELGLRSVPARKESVKRRNSFSSTDRSAPLSPPAPGAAGAGRGREGTAGSRCPPGAGATALSRPVVTRWHWSISVRLGGRPQLREPLRALPIPSEPSPSQGRSGGSPDAIPAQPSSQHRRCPGYVFWLRIYLGGKTEILAA